MKLKECLDKRICDVEVNANNTQTFREFIQEFENEFGIRAANLDMMSEEELQNYLNFMDELWYK